MESDGRLNMNCYPSGEYESYIQEMLPACGELQDDWYDFLDALKRKALSGKRVALFGCGDSASYPDSFCDALAEIRDGLEATGCTFVGALDAAEYDGCTSRICRDGKVIGLAVDDGASEAVSDARMEKWITAVGF